MLQKVQFWFYPPWLPEELCGRCSSEASKQTEVGAEKRQEAGRLPEQAIVEELLMNWTQYSIPPNMISEVFHGKKGHF